MEEINVRDSEMDNPKKLPTLGTQDEQNKTTIQYVSDTTLRKHK